MKKELESSLRQSKGPCQKSVSTYSLLRRVSVGAQGDAKLSSIKQRTWQTFMKRINEYKFSFKKGIKM